MIYRVDLLLLMVIIFCNKEKNTFVKFVGIDIREFDLKTLRKIFGVVQ